MSFIHTQFNLKFKGLQGPYTSWFNSKKCTGPAGPFVISDGSLLMADFRNPYFTTKREKHDFSVKLGPKIRPSQHKVTLEKHVPRG